MIQMSQQAVAKQTPTMQTTSDAVPSLRALSGDLSTLHWATTTHTHRHTHTHLYAICVWECSVCKMRCTIWIGLGWGPV